jgi:hypothetical protein
VRALLGDDDAVYEAAAAEAFPEHNKAHLVSLELPDRSGDVSTSLPLSLSLSLSPDSFRRFVYSFIHICAAAVTNSETEGYIHRHFLNYQ